MSNPPLVSPVAPLDDRLLADAVPGAFDAALAALPALRVATGTARGVGYRASSQNIASATNTLPLVLLHGIGSGAASWAKLLGALGAQRRVYAWDAPGYGSSTPVVPDSPLAADYARELAAWLDALGVARAIVVGHSLGALMAGAFAAAWPARVAGLMLLSPAAGYGAAEPAVRAQKRDTRLAMLAELGPAGLAEKRSANMLSANADDTARAWVRWNMARVIPHGYAQATHLLANADLASDLARFGHDGARCPLAVAVGSADTITPPDACTPVADAARVPLQIVPGVGHAGYIENTRAYATLLADFCAQCDAHAHAQSGGPQ